MKRALLGTLVKVLERMGGTHSVEDLLEEIRTNKKQGFGFGDSWAVTQIVDYPRFRAVEIWLVVGKRQDIDGLQEAVVRFAREVGAKKLLTYGRQGWGDHFAESFGWKKVATTTMYAKEL